MKEPHVPMEQLEVYRRYVDIADGVWSAVSSWPALARDTMGKQLICAIDSVGANLVEGDGRQGTADAVHFFVIARASVREARYWLDRAVARSVIPADDGASKIKAIEAATQLLNNLISYRRRQANGNTVREDGSSYDACASGPEEDESRAPDS